MGDYPFTVGDGKAHYNAYDIEEEAIAGMDI